MEPPGPCEARRFRARIDVHAGRREPLRRIWRYIGYDEPNYTYTPSGRALLSKLGTISDAPYWVRCHFLLCSGDGTGQPKWGSTNAYTEDASGRPVYSWDLVDRILDTVVETGCVPFVEIGFVPEALSTAPPTTPYADLRNGGWRFPPKDYGRWMDLVHALGAHCLARYGLREVDRWYWELWNEPDIFYWRGTVEEYNRLYDYTVARLISAIPQAKVGGPATTSPANPKAGAFLRSFLKHCTGGVNAVTGQTGTRLDYVSFHTKGGGYGFEPDAAKKTPTIHTLVHHVKVGLDIVAGFPALRGHEVILSECDPDGWAAGSVRDNPNLAYRNTEYYASYVASAVCKLIDLANAPGPRVDGMLTWAFQFETREIFAGLRTLSTNGIDKPVFNVFRLLADLGGTRLHLASTRARNPLCHPGGDNARTPPDVSGIAAVDETGEVQVLLASQYDDWDVNARTQATVCLSGLETGQGYTLSHQVIDGAGANAHTAWVQMGRPQPPTKSQLQELADASCVRKQSLGEVTLQDGQCEVCLDLAAHSVCLLKLAPVW